MPRASGDRGRACQPSLQNVNMSLQWSLCKNPVYVSFRGAAGDGESRTALKTLKARFLAPLGMTVEGWLSHGLQRGPRQPSCHQIQREQSQNVYENERRVQNVAWLARVMSHKFVHKIRFKLGCSLEPRQGRHRIAQGASP